VTPLSKTEEMPSWLNRQRFRAVMISVIVAACAYLIAVFWSGWDDVSSAIAIIGWYGVVIALVLSLVNYGLRFIRWQLYLSVLGYSLSWLPSLQIYLAGFALTTTPGKSGELLRSILLKQRGMPLTSSVTAFLCERLSDVLAVTALTLFGFVVYPDTQLLILSAATILILWYWIILQEKPLCFLQKTLKRFVFISHWLTRIQGLMQQIRRCHTPVLLASTTALSLVAWGAEAFAFHIILELLGYDIPLGIAIFIYAISMLAGAISFMPGGLGGAEAVMITLLLWQGVDTGPAVAATLIIRLATLWFAVLLGLLAALGLKPSSNKNVL
jgi:uncharacterized protein (TIRG00374 family)